MTSSLPPMTSPPPDDVISDETPSSGDISSPKSSQVEENKTKEKEEIEIEETEIKSVAPAAPQLIKISSEPLLPDLSLNISEDEKKEEEEEPTTSSSSSSNATTSSNVPTNKETLDFMTGIFAQASHDVIEEGMRYRHLRKPLMTSSNSKTADDDCDVIIPATSTYYKTSASKAKIMNLVQEKLIRLQPEEDEKEETAEEMNYKKLMLVESLRGKLSELSGMKELLDNERKENENLGEQVDKVVKFCCTNREGERFTSFVREVDNIIKLLISLSGRLARVENALLIHQRESPERAPLADKRRVLIEQHREARQLKEEIDAKQQRISEMLAKNFNQEQFADYEHFIKMKSALIVEQREFEDKIKLGREQMQLLMDGLPEEMLNQISQDEIVQL